MLVSDGKVVSGGEDTSWRGLMLLGAVERRGALEVGRRVVILAVVAVIVFRDLLRGGV